LDDGSRGAPREWLDATSGLAGLDASGLFCLHRIRCKQLSPLQAWAGSPTTNLAEDAFNG
jgi:hypothetical protein